MSIQAIKQQSDPYVIETSKQTEIIDRFGNVRYKITLTNAETENVDEPAFQIEVWYCIKSAEPTLIYRSEIISAYEDAKKLFDDKVNSYTILVKVETKEVQNIYIYSDKIHYHIVDPDRCAVCKFAQPVPNSCELYSKDKCGKFECTNNAIHNSAEDFNALHDRATLEDPGYGLANLNNVCYDLYNCRDHYLPLNPEVDGNGVCDFFERKQDN